MLPSKRRLNLKKDFRWVAAGGKLGNNYLNLFFRFGDNSEPKVGITVSKNTFKKAVERNRARRLVSKGFEELYSQLPSGINIIAFPKEEVLGARSEEISRSLKELIERLKNV